MDMIYSKAIYLTVSILFLILAGVAVKYLKDVRDDIRAIRIAMEKK